MGAWRWAWVGLALLLLTAPARPAAASAGDIYGFSSRASALSGAVTAREGDFASPYYNPGALGSLRGPEASVGLLGFGSALRINGLAAPRLQDPLGILLGLATPVPLGGVLQGRLHVGALLYILPDRIERVVARRPDAPFYPYYNDRAGRLVVIPGAAVRLHDLVSVGVGINFFARLSGSILGNPGVTRAIEPRVDEQIITVASPHVGLRLGPFATRHGQLALGATYRDSFSSRTDTVVLADVVGSQLGVNVRAFPFFTPGALVAGAAFDRARDTFSLDLSWVRWSGFPGPYVRVLSVLPLIGPVAEPLPRTPLSDTGEVRAGYERRFDLGPRLRQAVLRVGYGFAPSPVLPQTGITNLADGHRHILSTGGGLTWRLGPAEMTADAHFQAHLLQPRTDTKGPDVDPANFGSPTLRSSGAVLSAGFTLTVRRPLPPAPAVTP